MKTSYTLSLIAGVLAALASAAGLFVPALYRDGDYLATLWQGNDRVTLLFVLPALFFILLWEKASPEKQLIQMGLLLYLFYNYAFYLFAAAFNTVFLLYVAILTLSAFALIYGLSALPLEQMAFSPGYRIWIVAYLLLIACILGMVEIPPIIRFITGGTIPELIQKTGHQTNIVYALDLSIVMPLSLLASVWLWQQKKWGYVLAALMLVKGITYGLVLTVNTLIITIRGIGSDTLLPFYIFVVLGGLGGLMLLLGKAGKRDA